jgi:hypothetical protein
VNIFPQKVKQRLLIITETIYENRLYLYLYTCNSEGAMAIKDFTEPLEPDRLEKLHANFLI